MVGVEYSRAALNDHFVAQDGRSYTHRIRPAIPSGVVNRGGEVARRREGRNVIALAVAAGSDVVEKRRLAGPRTADGQYEIAVDRLLSRRRM